ncbi:hypothetical protein Tco_0905769, partial [Tanacetum coccineum]
MVVTMDKRVDDTVKDHKRKHDDDEDPPAGPNQGKKTKRRRTNESESSKKPSTTKETPKDKAPSKEIFISADGVKSFLLIMFLLVMFSFLLTEIETYDLMSIRHIEQYGIRRIRDFLEHGYAISSLMDMAYWPLE